MPEFLLICIALAALAALFVVSPLMLNRSVESGERGTINVALFKDRLQELEQDRLEGVITDEELQSLKTELERRLLEDASGEQSVAIVTSKPANRVIILFPILNRANLALNFKIRNSG